MKKTILALSVMTLSCMLFNTGCAESKNDSAESKKDSSTTTLRTSAFEGVQGNCTNGGVKIEVLVDGTVDDTQTQYLCNGVDGQNGQAIHNALIATSDEVDDNCTSGGIRMDFGLDANDNGTLDAPEILGSRYICNGEGGENGENGKDSSIRTTTFEDAQGGCILGGIKVEALIGEEVQPDQTQYICNGANGQNGQDGQDGTNGHSALVATSDEVGENCANGGTRIDFGLDTNDNAMLDADEILSSRYVCNGANGADGQDGQDGKDGVDGHDGTNGKNATIQTTSFNGAQNGCTNGGTKIEVLLDGVVQSAQTRYVCNGVNGQDGQDGQDGHDGQDGTNGKNATIQTTSFNGAQNGCTNGGTKIEVLLDGVVQSAQTRYICNGVNGADGQDGEDGHDGANGKNATIQTTSFSGAQGNCTNGGIKLEVLLDGVVQAGQTQYICSGTSSGNPCVDGLTDLLTDIDNCGACGNACDYGLDCINGKCLGSTNCGGGNHNTTTDLSHCGTCNHRCSDGTTCKVGECVVAPGPAYCGTQTVQLNTLRHCESCAACADGLLCQNNQCVEGQGQMICNNVIVDSRTDSANCGSCGNVCNAGFECVDSACKRISSLTSSTTITCNAQTVKPYSNRNNCSGCGIDCSGLYACHAGSCSIPDVGETITFGHYEQDNNTTNGKEPIVWRILDKNSAGQYLVISEKVLDEKPYNTSNISITWEKSTIRSWLNGYGEYYNTVGTDFTSNNFIDTAFTAEEKAKIVLSNVPAHANPKYSISPGNATTDKIFLLSITEAKNYFSSQDDRIADATRYAVKDGFLVFSGPCTDVYSYCHDAFWWLRSPGRVAYRAAYIGGAGSLVYDGDLVYYDDIGVRPALWVEY